MRKYPQRRPRTQHPLAGSPVVIVPGKDHTLGCYHDGVSTSRSFSALEGLESYTHALQRGPSQRPDLSKGCGKGGPRNALVEAADQQHVAPQVDQAGHGGRQQGRHGVHGRQEEGLRHEDQQRRRQPQAPAHLAYSAHTLASQHPRPLSSSAQTVHTECCLHSRKEGSRKNEWPSGSAVFLQAVRNVTGHRDRPAGSCWVLAVCRARLAPPAHIGDGRLHKLRGGGAVDGAQRGGRVEEHGGRQGAAQHASDRNRVRQDRARLLLVTAREADRQHVGGCRDSVMSHSHHLPHSPGSYRP